MELDIYVPGYSLAFEYQGRHHYDPESYYAKNTPVHTLSCSHFRFRFRLFHPSASLCFLILIVSVSPPTVFFVPSLLPMLEISFVNFLILTLPSLQQQDTIDAHKQQECQRLGIALITVPYHW